uniref:Uncharacterized protein n=1 Tax=Arundo donax TaxID=35708 RepID=A0A0A9ANZ6_ARUDO
MCTFLMILETARAGSRLVPMGSAVQNSSQPIHSTLGKSCCRRAWDPGGAEGQGRT